ncbi:phosphate ABC transporter permease subunit PstC [Oscillospiraceae bacterium LTW-04]|nr:phosphate ABC transporter permease subunit PstC [Oscillospiraceae bacterium MB24-C1]
MVVRPFERKDFVKLKEQVMKLVFLLAACNSIAAVALICVFLFTNGVPAMVEIGFFNFILGQKWKPSNEIFGILPMIAGSIWVTLGAMVIGVPTGIFTAVFLARFSPKWLYRLLKPAIDLLAGIPSVIYGFFGLVVLVPMIRNIFEDSGTTGDTMLTAILMLGMMILPTVINVSEAAIRAVPESYYEGALALGATKERSVFFAVLPAAKSGLLAAAILGVGRAIGETMAVMMIAGNQARMPAGLLKGIRTLTSNIVLEIGYAADLHREALVATGVVLFVFILIINLLFSLVTRREKS